MLWVKVRTDKISVVYQQFLQNQLSVSVKLRSDQIFVICNRLQSNNGKISYRLHLMICHPWYCSTPFFSSSIDPPFKTIVILFYEQNCNLFGKAINSGHLFFLARQGTCTCSTHHIEHQHQHKKGYTFHAQNWMEDILTGIGSGTQEPSPMT